MGIRTITSIAAAAASSTSRGSSRPMSLMPLEGVGLTVQAYVDRLHAAIRQVLEEFDLSSAPRSDLPGIFSGTCPDRHGRDRRESMDRLPWSDAQRRPLSRTLRPAGRAGDRHGAAAPDLHGIPASAGHADVQGRASRSSERSRKSSDCDRQPPLHATPADPPEGPRPCLRSQSWMNRPARPIEGAGAITATRDGRASLEAAAGVAAAADPGGRRNLVHAEPCRGARAGDRLRERPLSQPLRVLDAAHRDVHGPGRRLHPAVRVLRGQARSPRGRRAGRARTARRGLPSIGAEARRDHVRHAR